MIELTVALQTGIQPISSLVKGVNLFPNPATNELTFSSKSAITEVLIINLLGQQVFSHAYNTDKVQVDISGLQQGVYYVRLNGTEVRKFVKE